MNSLPWLVGGDYNEILFDSGKKGGTDKSASTLLDFHETLNKAKRLGMV